MSELVSRECEAVIPPSSLFVFWPGAEPPLAEEIRCRLVDWGHAALGDEDAPEETLWSFWLDGIERPTSHLVWCEAVGGNHLALLDQVRWRSPAQEAAARGCRWMVGLEGALSLRAPTMDYQAQLRMGESISRDWAPVYYDASAFQFRTPEELRHLVDTRTPPRSNCLYSVHQVAEPRRVELGAGGAEAEYWLHTHGLERAGIPDLELFGVPARLVPAACELIEAVADYWLEFGTPDPQVPFGIGEGLEIAWRPWQAVAAERRAADVGGWDYRERDLGHAGFRAVLVRPAEAVAGGGILGRWLLPLTILERLTRPETTLFKTPAESERMARLARERWGRFGLLFASRHPPGWRFAVKLGFPSATRPQTREHLWFDVLAIKPDRVKGKLVSTPLEPDDLPLPDSDWHSLDRLSDWRILTPDGVYDPETADALLE